MQVAKLDTINPRVFLQLSKYVGVQDMLQLSQVNKDMRKAVSKCLQPMLKKYYDLQSYTEKYPFKCIRATLNRKLLVLSNSEVDELLLNGSRIKPKNVGVNPDVHEPENSNQQQKKLNEDEQELLKIKNKKGPAKKSGKKGSFHEVKETPIQQAKESFSKKKLVQVIPGLSINRVMVGKHIAVFSDGSTACVMKANKVASMKKIKDVHCQKIIKGVVKMQMTSTLVYQLEDSSLNFIDESTETANDLVSVQITNQLDDNCVWSAGHYRLLIVRDNQLNKPPKLTFYSKFSASQSSDQTIPLNFVVKNISVGKDLFYLVSDSGEVYQGEYEKQSIVKITNETDLFRLHELQLSGQANTIQNESVIQENNEANAIENEKEARRKEAASALGFGLEVNNSNLQRQEKVYEVFTNGASTFMMVNDSSIPHVQFFNNHELIQFFDKIGLSKYGKTILFQKIDGEKIMSLDEVDLEETLGMADVSEQNHLMLNINMASRDQ